MNRTRGPNRWGAWEEEQREVQCGWKRESKGAYGIDNGHMGKGPAICDLVDCVKKFCHYPKGK